MTIRELEEQSGECVELDAPFGGNDNKIYKLSVSGGDVWLMRLADQWRSVRHATVHDARAAADAERRIA